MIVFSLLFQLTVLLSMSETVETQLSVKEIVIVATSMKDREGFGSKKGLCEVKFSIENNGPGTIYRIAVELDGFDDRGRPVEEILSASVDSRSIWEKNYIRVGSTISDVGDATFEEECRYLGAISAVSVEPENCAIRNLKENADCYSMIELRSAIPTLKIKR